VCKQKSFITTKSFSFITDNVKAKIFSQYTGLLHTISEQNESILTLSLADQFSNKVSLSLDELSFSMKVSDEFENGRRKNEKK